MPQLPQLPAESVAGMRMIVGRSSVRAEEVNPYSFAKSQIFGDGGLKWPNSSSWDPPVWDTRLGRFSTPYGGVTDWPLSVSLLADSGNVPL